MASLAPMFARYRLAAAAGALLTSALVSAPTQAGELRFSTTAKGGVVATGNTLGLAKQPGANGPGTGDSIGTFTSLDQTLVDDVPANLGNPWPMGTTYDWTLNGSSAVLSLPANPAAEVEVVYAELVWSGSYLYGTENVSAELDEAVTLSANGAELDVLPDLDTAVTLSGLSGQGFAVNYYMRSADVTEFVAEHLGTSYALAGVPATQDLGIEQLNAAGWTLVVAYRASDSPTRNLTVFVGGQFVDEGATEDYTVSGFCTPPQGTVEGAAIISAVEGDANRTGDSLQIAATIQGPFAPLAGPNNLVNNFFASQINDAQGNLDTSGSFGDLNHDALAGVNVSGGRQSWDITTIGLSSAASQLSAGQTSAVLRATTTGDSFMPVLAALAIDVNSPNFEDGTAIAVAPASLELGEQATLTLDIVNSGGVTATGLLFTAPLGQGLELVSFTIDGVAGDVGQNPVTTADLVTGVGLGEVDAAASREIVMVVEATADPAPAAGWSVTAGWSYAYVSCVGEDPLSEHSFALAQIGFIGDGDDDDAGEADAGEADAGDDSDAGDGDDGSEAGGSGDAGGDGNSEGDTDGGDAEVGETGGDLGADLGDSGCNCSTTDERPAAPIAAFGLLALLGLVRRRR